MTLIGQYINQDNTWNFNLSFMRNVAKKKVCKNTVVNTKKCKQLCGLLNPKHSIIEAGSTSNWLMHYVCINQKNTHTHTCWSSHEVKTQHFNIILLCLNSLYNCVIAGGLSQTSPLKLMSNLSLIHRHRNLSQSTRGRSDGGRLAWWTVDKSPERLVPQKFTDSKVSWGRARQKDVGPFLHGLMEGRGKTERGRREWAGEKKHKRLLSVIQPPFNSPQGRHTPHFPSFAHSSSAQQWFNCILYIQNTLVPNKWRLLLLIGEF